MFYCTFESSVNSYDSQTDEKCIKYALTFESSVNSYDSQTVVLGSNTSYGLRVV